MAASCACATTTPHLGPWTRRGCNLATVEGLSLEFEEEVPRPMGSTLQFDWPHDGYQRICVVIPRELRDESRSLLVAFRSLRQATTLDEVRAEADDIAQAKDVRLTWDSELDEQEGRRITIGVLRP